MKEKLQKTQQILREKVIPVFANSVDERICLMDIDDLIESLSQVSKGEPDAHEHTAESMDSRWYVTKEPFVTKANRDYWQKLACNNAGEAFVFQRKCEFQEKRIQELELALSVKNAQLQLPAMLADSEPSKQPAAPLLKPEVFEALIRCLDDRYHRIPYHKSSGEEADANKSLMRARNLIVGDVP